MISENTMDRTTEIVVSYVNHNTLAPDALVKLVEDIARAIEGLQDDLGTTHRPAVPIANSYTDDYIICLEDGKKVTLLTRHLNKHYGMTPAEYREKWKLPGDYPFVTKIYSEKRSKLAKDSGFGKKS